MKREFVYDDSSIPCIKYFMTKGPVCTIEVGSFVGVDIDPVHSVFGIITNMNAEGFALHFDTADSPSSFSFSEIEDIVLISSRKDVLRVSHVVSVLRETYGDKRVNDVLYGKQVDFDV